MSLKSFHTLITRAGSFFLERELLIFSFSLSPSIFLVCPHIKNRVAFLLIGSNLTSLLVLCWLFLTDGKRFFGCASYLNLVRLKVCCALRELPLLLLLDDSLISLSVRFSLPSRDGENEKGIARVGSFF